MNVHAITYEPSDIPDELYQRALLLLDAESSARIKRFYRREDACRRIGNHICFISGNTLGTLIGRILPRMLLHDRGIALAAMEFSSTETGKPFVTTDPAIAYNISHDNGLVAMASSSNTHNPPAFSLGIDVMKVRIPGRESFASFVETAGDQLTAHERHLISSAKTQDEALEHFFWMWTAKEAYTKALGLGLGFDFRRVEFDPAQDIVRVDGSVPKGWMFSKFVVVQGSDRYQGVVAEFVGGDQTTVILDNECLTLEDAASFVHTAIERLRS